MAETCGTTRGAGNSRAFEDAANARITGELQGGAGLSSLNPWWLFFIPEVESDLPEDLRDDALRVFRAAISDKCTIQDAINKVIHFLKLISSGGQALLTWVLMVQNLSLAKTNCYFQVNKDALTEVETRFKGQRFKVSFLVFLKQVLFVSSKKLYFPGLHQVWLWYLRDHH